VSGKARPQFLVYVHEIMLLLKDGIVKDMQNKELLRNVLRQLMAKDVLDRNAMQFLQLMQPPAPNPGLAVKP
jgi:hypothetical protein